MVLHLYTFGLRMCPDSTTPSYLAVPGGLAGGVRGKRDPRGYFFHTPWQLLGWRLGWKDCCRGWLWLDLLAISRTLLLCSVAVSGVMLPTVPDLAGKKTKTDMERSGPTRLHPPHSAGPAACRPDDPVRQGKKQKQAWKEVALHSNSGRGGRPCTIELY